MMAKKKFDMLGFKKEHPIEWGKWSFLHRKKKSKLKSVL
jgi:hypothetical protein